MSFTNAFADGFDAQDAAPEPPDPTPTPGWMVPSIRAFIKWHPTTTGILRRHKVATAAGGWIWDNPTMLLDQTFRCYPTTDRAQTRVRSDGQVVMPDWRIIGELGLDMKVGDQFTEVTGHKLEVVFVRSDMYAIRAEAFESSGP
jgi:hypothetical protein